MIAFETGGFTLTSAKTWLYVEQTKGDPDFFRHALPFWFPFKANPKAAPKEIAQASRGPRQLAAAARRFRKPRGPRLRALRLEGRAALRPLRQVAQRPSWDGRVRGRTRELNGFGKGHLKCLRLSKQRWFGRTGQAASKVQSLFDILFFNTNHCYISIPCLVGFPYEAMEPWHFSTHERLDGLD